MIAANQKMLQLMCGLVVATADSALPAELQQILDAGIIEEDGCWFLAMLRNRNGNISINKAFDLTGLECLINKVYFDAEPNVAKALEKQGFLFANALKILLAPYGVFKIIIAVGQTDFEKTPNLPSCTIRFHKVRNGESWLADDLEGYPEEALLILTTGDQN